MKSNIIISDKTRLAEAAWLDFAKRLEADDPILCEEVALLIWAISQPPGDMTRDKALFEIGFRFALHRIEQGALGDNGSSYP